MTGREWLFVVSTIAGMLLGTLLPWDLLAPLRRMINRRRSRTRVRPAGPGAPLGRLVSPDVTGGVSPIICGRHPNVPGEWDGTLLSDLLPIGWICPACRVEVTGRG